MMRYDFNADEVFEMAEQMERNGEKFYKSAAATIDDEAHKKLLLELAAMETDHEKTFKAMRSDLKAAEKSATVFDPEGEAALYLRALVDTRVFFEKKVDVSSMEKILKAAIEAEKDSIVFYLGMKNAVPDKLGKDRIEGIIKEEMGHIRLLSRELTQLKK
ncbi:MAG: ferritin family protein [Desulfobacterales bacterium]|nr:ferritin family protein [Desulfobacterales bacterium]